MYAVFYRPLFFPACSPQIWFCVAARYLCYSDNTFGATCSRAENKFCVEHLQPTLVMSVACCVLFLFTGLCSRHNYNVARFRCVTSPIQKCVVDCDRSKSKPLASSSFRTYSKFIIRLNLWIVAFRLFFIDITFHVRDEKKVCALLYSQSSLLLLISTF